jgi:hypothetical protein
MICSGIMGDVDCYYSLPHSIIFHLLSLKNPQDIISDSSEFALLRKRLRPEKVWEETAYGSMLFRNRIARGRL